MRLFVDLHMHSCLSPCGHEDMTPNNIVNMAYVKGLDAIAVADHNSAKQLPALQAVAMERNLLLLPAMEVTTQEDVHVLCYFPTLAQALEMDAFVYAHLLPIPNRQDLWGPQELRDEADQLLGQEERLLAQATDLDIAELADKARALGGISVPAHINRSANGILNMLGMMPLDVNFPTVEVRRAISPPPIDLTSYLVLHASDAHCLEDIAEPDFALEVEERSVEALFQSIRDGKKTAERP